MCDLHAAPPPALRARRRLKLWEIDSQWHCTIIGTCLTLAEIRVVAARFGVRFTSERPSDYEVHTAAIHLVSAEPRIGKALTKLLDRKHAALVARSAKAAGEVDLAALWAEALARGEIAGACWAVMSHAAAGDALRGAVYGEIHMLSHQVGAAARADLQHLHRLTREKAELEAKVARQQDRLRDEIVRRDAEIRELRHLLEAQVGETRRLAHAVHAADELARLKVVVADFDRRLAREESRRRAAEDAARDARAERHEILHRMSLLTVANADLAEENRLLEARIAPADGLARCEGECADLDLCGRCVLFVGGRNRHIPHFRRFVEEAGGTFAHHDGGFEEGTGRLHGMFGQADVVLFPVDCVSHAAHDEVKRLCRRWDKPFVPVRRAGLGAFLQALAAVAQAKPEMGCSAPSPKPGM